MCSFWWKLIMLKYEELPRFLCKLWSVSANAVYGVIQYLHSETMLTYVPVELLFFFLLVLKVRHFDLFPLSVCFECNENQTSTVYLCFFCRASSVCVCIFQLQIIYLKVVFSKINKSLFKIVTLQHLNALFFIYMDYEGFYMGVCSCIILMII